MTEKTTTDPKTDTTGPIAELTTFSRQKALRRGLREANDYQSWQACALALDAVSGREQWKSQDESRYYDSARIAARLARIRELIDTENVEGLVFEIEQGMHSNLGGIGHPMLFNKARFGTKDLIANYFDILIEALDYLEQQPADVLSMSRKNDLFSRASHCNGRSALLMSSGGSLIYFHYGVVKALFDNGLLPRVISGSSAGALVAAVLATHPDEELSDLFTLDNIRFGNPWEPRLLERITGLRRLVTLRALDEIFERLVPDLTFREAYERSGRHVSISVSPSERHQRPRLLNAMTSPHVLIRSAVRASCAIPGFAEPAQLIARNRHGDVVPFLKSKWIDGGFAADLPFRQLARLYGVNHSIVSMINPLSLNTIRDQKLQNDNILPLRKMIKSSARNGLRSADVLIGKYLPTSRVGAFNKVMHDLLIQESSGDITLAPSHRLSSLFKVFSPLTNEEINALLRDGQQHCWRRMEMIRHCTRVSRRLDELVPEPPVIPEPLAP